MKTVYLLLLILLPLGLFAQKTGEELARRVFTACIKNDLNGFKRMYPSESILTTYFKVSDKKKVFPKDVVTRCYPKGLAGAVYGFELFQKAIKEFGLNVNDIKITGSDMVDNDIEIMQNKKKIGAVYNKFISLYFTSGGVKYAFVVPKAIQFKGRWFMGDQIVSLHEVDKY
ncbi:hypothetical protein [Flavobacterium psychrotrophum]|uniref:hypothetical protein n=1 Tax=Flavobacterium psychrotrophum TaxID=2294119 RepID=UPI000E32008E|nr:hypothetical protein [Flavobacterium psychrotrophum]